ncbi:MAG: Eco57I restriction-modification methylase domain-containing protein [Desulfobacterales bacterium]
MNTADAKLTIQKAIRAFSEGSMTENAISLFSKLGYNTQRQNPLGEKTFACFRDSFLSGETRFREDKALAADWKSIDLLFQLSKEEVSDTKSLSDTKKMNDTIIESYLFFAVELEKCAHSRTALAQITREINKVFSMPVMLIFRHGEHLTVSMISRRLHKRDESKDVLEKVTLIKDISIANPHRAHVEILFDLSFDELKQVHGFTNFVELHDAWQKTLDTKELSKKFFQELANWYFRAAGHVSFPDDMEKNRDIRNATSLIRLITRIIFIWFIKEKNLVPENLFNSDELKNILKDFNQMDSRNYYNAILQNLFFACLNRKMNERGFAKHGTHQENRSEYGVKTLFRHADMFAIPKEEIVKLFENIPFLNGGLFDCLDRPDEDGRILYADGFSRNPKKQALVPDFLFFGKEQECDLNAVFGTKNKKYKVKGLIPLLESYKFTVAENTPVEEEIALDPELLGKVFENLLASYNPETRTTARKQTGSFYTPREIVSYMVDESLTAYLKQKLEAHKSENTESRLRDLFSYSENPNPFDEKETQILVNAIDNCRILDPACGSGAFPMGILHKMVHVLHKLDPRNRLWKEQQMAKVDHLIAEARNISDSGIRDKIAADLKNSREDIEEAFAGNELDYGRKLYLIESCVYGVDIQPVAIQISKLRFFISLIADQRIARNKENFGVRSLPNLETKFVAANTLIGLDKPKQRGLKNLELEKLEKEMKDLRHRYFRAKSRREKLDCQKKDRELRKNISEFLVKDGWNNEAAGQLAAFDPYDQNACSPFFDPEWMFGIKDGFDIVIGNPPYGASCSIENKKYFRSNYKSAKTGELNKGGTKIKVKGSLDTFSLFIENGFNLLKKNGNLIYIVPISVTSGDSMTGLHELLENNCEQIKISSYSVRPQPIFENAVVNTSIIFFMKTNTSCRQIYSTKMYRKNKEFDMQKLLNNLQFVDVQTVKLRGRYPKISTEMEKNILEKLFAQKNRFGDFLTESQFPIYYRTTGGRYFKIITPYPTGSTKEKPVFVNKKYQHFLGAVLSSNLYFWFYQIYSNNLDLKFYEIEAFPLPDVDLTKPETLSDIENIYNQYLEDIEKKAKIRKTEKYANIESFKEYKILRSKHFIDKLDDLICPLYGLTQEETDFIKKYEIEFRTDNHGKG